MPDGVALPWLVAMTRAQSEDSAELALIRAGYVTYLARFKRQLRGVKIAADGRRVRTRGAGAMVERALWPYIFIRDAPGQDCYPITLIAGIAKLLRKPPIDGVASPALLDDAVVAQIRQHCIGGKFDELAAAPERPPRRDLAPGDLVRVNAGDLAGMIGELVMLDQAGRARLLIAELLGRSNVPANVDAFSLVRA